MKDHTHINTTKIVCDAHGLGIPFATKASACSTYPDDEMRARLWHNPLILVKWGFEHSYIRGPIMCALHAKKAYDLLNVKVVDDAGYDERVNRAMYHLGCASHFIVDMATPFHSEAARMLNHVPGGSHPMFETFVDQHWGGLFHLIEGPADPIYRGNSLSHLIGAGAYTKVFGRSGHKRQIRTSNRDVYGSIMGLACRVSLDAGLQFPSVFEAMLSRDPARKLKVSHDSVERCVASAYILFDHVLGRQCHDNYPELFTGDSVT